MVRNRTRIPTGGLCSRVADHRPAGTRPCPRTRGASAAPAARIFAAILTLLSCAASSGVVTSVAIAASPLPTHPENPFTTHRAYASLYVFDVRTGTELLADNADEPRAPASLTKMMTLLLLMETVESGGASWSDSVTVPWQSEKVGGSGVGLQDKEVLLLEDAAKALIVSSGNDAAIAIAEHLAHSENVWVHRMNRRAKELGMLNTYYKTSHGLDGWRSQSVTTAHDQGLLVQELMRHPRILEWTSSRSMVIRGGQTIVNTNKLLGVFPGLDGVKTGYTGPAKFCLASTAKRDGFRVGCVLLGGWSSVDRFQETEWALTEAFLRFRLEEPVRAGQPVGPPISIPDGDPALVQPIATEDLPIVRPRTDSLPLQVVVVPKTGLRLPLAAGTEVARIEVLEGERLATRSVAVIDSPVVRLSWWDRLKRRFQKKS
ncbi:MAG: D-alanyl-D-alanine carboxypeptidase family protein [Candidatus Eisenbacteria bacterium]